MKIFICIEHDVIYRNFMLSGAFDVVEKYHEVFYLFPSNAPSRLSEEFQRKLSNKNHFVVDEHKQRQKAWKQIFFAELMWNSDPKKRALKTLHKTMLGIKATILFLILGFPILRYFFINQAKKTLLKTDEPNLHEKFLKEQPDCVIHPTVLNGVYANELVNICKKFRIPTVYIMNSWDNPSTKGTISGLPDFLLVWGPQTKKHAIDYMKMPSHCVIEFGAAQFEQYNSKKRALEICSRDAGSKTINILFAGSSKETDEYGLLVKLDEAINSFGWNCKIIYRPHPWGNCGLNGHLIYSHPWDNVSFAPSMVAYVREIGESKSGCCINKASIEGVLDEFHNSAMVISPLSTILIEAAINRILPICLMPEPDQRGRHFKLSAPLPHFEDYFESEIFQTVQGISGLIKNLEYFMILAKDQVFLDSLYVESNHFVKKFDTAWASRLENFLGVLNKP
jgi:hypothetical protein